MKENKLDDRSATGRERPWKQHKKNNEKVVEVLHVLGDKDKAHKIADCGNVLEFAVCPNGHGKWLNWAFFCKDRICSICNWRKRLFMFFQFLMVAHKVLEMRPNTEFIFVTLTVENCKKTELSKTVTHMNKSFSTRFLRNQRVKNAFKGAFKSLEITYNPERDDFHPHFHIIFAVNKSYFKDTTYITQPELTQIWGGALRVGYKPVCDVRKIRPRNETLSTVTESILEMDKTLISGMSAAAGEVAKYATKIADVVSPKIMTKARNGKKADSQKMIDAKLRLRSNIKKQAEILGYLIDGLHYRRLVSYTGIFKEAYQALNCKDVEQSDLILMPGEEKVCRCKICQSELVHFHYIWNGIDYFLRERKGGNERF